jgi:hypothetical protein
VAITVEVVVAGQPRPPKGVPIIVQIRDTGYQDAPATVLGEARGVVSGSKDDLLAAIRVDVNADTLPRHTTVWAHVDVDNNARVSGGDYVTMQSYPVSGPSAKTRVAVKQV